MLDKIMRKLDTPQSDAPSHPVTAAQMLPALAAVVVEPILYGNDPVKYKLIFHFMTADGPKDILIASVSNGDSLNELASMVRSELGMT